MSSWSSFTATLQKLKSCIGAARSWTLLWDYFSNTFGQGFMVTKVLLEALYMEHAERDELHTFEKLHHEKVAVTPSRVLQNDNDYFHL